MNYRIVYLDTNVLASEGAAAVAHKVQTEVDSYVAQGWRFIGVQQVATVVTNPGSNGCMGIGAVPTTRASIAVNVLVFESV